MEECKYKILNLDESGRFWLDDYEIPQGWDVSQPFDTLEEAVAFIKSLKDTERYRYDLHYIILGLYIKDDHYPQVVYKCHVSYS